MRAGVDGRADSSGRAPTTAKEEPLSMASARRQSGNSELNEDCGIFSPFVQFGGENFDKFTKYGQLSGGGCVFPATWT
jgi:hypothetical protein